MALLPQGTRVSPKLSFCAWFELPGGSIKEFCCVMVTWAEPGHEHSQCEGQDPRKPSRDGASVAFGFWASEDDWRTDSMCFIYQAFISSDDWSIGVGVEVSVVVGGRVVLGQRFFV